MRSGAASLGLLTASALMGAHGRWRDRSAFHFFVMLSVIALYQDWFPYLLAIGIVVVQHGAMGRIMPAAVYNHPGAIANP